MSSINKRGRPLGSGKNDSRFLAEIADLLVANPELKPRSAMIRVISNRDGLWEAASKEAMLRRLQVKWKSHKIKLLQDARNRADRPQRPTSFRDLVELSVRLDIARKAFRSPENLAKIATAAIRMQKLLQIRGIPTENSTKMSEYATGSMSRIHRIQKVIEGHLG